MSPRPENPDVPATLPPSHLCAPSEFTAEERALLLRLAHDSIEAALEGLEISTKPPSAHLSEPRGAFTTLYVKGGLRGCVGYVFPVASLYRTVVETARAAAFGDYRFSPLTSEEARNLTVHLSILSSVEPIRAEDVEVGRHGLVVSHEGRRGLLLPQVSVEHGWGRVTFLEQTCLKAGLPADSWMKGAIVEAFTAEVFGDSENGD